MGGSGPDSLIGGLGADLVNGQGGSNAAAGGDGTGRNVGDNMAGLTDVFDETLRFLTMPVWSRSDA